MADGVGINGANGVQSNLPGSGTPSQAAESASHLPKSQTPEAPRRPEPPSVAQPTTYSSEHGVGAAAHSKVVARLLEQNATIYAPGLARIPLPTRPDGTPRAVPKKPAGPMVAPRELDGGRSPLASGSLQDARGSVDALGGAPSTSGEQGTLDDAHEGAYRMPSRHGLVAYTKNSRGDNVYLTQERWLHIRENHMDPTPQPRGKRTTTYWPTRHAVSGPSMTDQQVVGVIMDTVRRGTLRTEVRDTRMAEYDLPMHERAAYGVSEAKVSMAPDGLVLSAYPGAGENVLAVYEMTPEDHSALSQATGGSAVTTASAGDDDRLFRTNIATTSFG